MKYMRAWAARLASVLPLAIAGGTIVLILLFA